MKWLTDHVVPFVLGWMAGGATTVIIVIVMIMGER